MIARPRRSVLYMPGSNAKALAKAATLAADALILDLEDSVASDAKIAARGQVSDAVSAGGFGGREAIVRVNGMHTPWGEGDLIAACAAGPDAILLPKVDGPERHGRRSGAARERRARWDTAMGDDGDAQRYFERRLDRRRRRRPGLAPDGAGHGRQRSRQGDPRSPHTRAGHDDRLARALLIAARAHGVDVIDGVFNDMKDLEGFRAECVQGRDMGFDGKTLIHPSQIDVCKRFSSPRPRRSRAPAPSSRLSRFPRMPARRHSTQRPDGRAAACRHGPPHAGHRGCHRRIVHGCGLIAA